MECLHRALSAFVEEDAKIASQFQPKMMLWMPYIMISIMVLLKNMIADPRLIEPITLLMWVVHNLERLADRVTNICERTVFIATGELMEMDLTDDEDNE